MELNANPAKWFIPLAILTLILHLWNFYQISYILGIINRWLRIIVIAGSLSLICLFLGWDGGREFWVLFSVFSLSWILIEWIYRWIAIQAINYSTLPLFPRFKINLSGDEWPIGKQYLQLREKIRVAGFKFDQALCADISNGLRVRISVFHNTDSTLRLQVTFLPQYSGATLVCLHFSTYLSDGHRLITDNHILPFAGFYPEYWHVIRKPLIRSFNCLMDIHLKRIAISQSQPIPWRTEPLDDINEQQYEFERINLELGFLLPPSEHEEHGRISHEGRYRIWKEMLLLDYLGRSARYD